MKLREIERLRAFAVLLVVNSHLSKMKVFSGPYFEKGWTGVYLFFVISGFVISRSILHELPLFEPQASFLKRIKKSQLALKIFFCRRAFRILPMAFAWMIIPVFLCLFYNNSKVFGEIQLLLQECRDILTLHYNYLLTTDTSKILGYYWSLIVEEQFYLLFPFFLIFFSSKEKRMIAILTCIGIVTFLIRPFTDATGELEHLQLSHRVFDVLLVGVLILHPKRESLASLIQKHRKIVSTVVVPICLFGVWCTPGFLSEEFLYNVGVPIIVAFAAILVYLASLDQGIVLEIPILKNVFEFLGSRSYGIYLIHLQAYYMICEFVFRNGADIPVFLRPIIAYHPVFNVIELGLTVFLSEMCYRFIEKPLINYSKVLSDRWRVKPDSAKINLGKKLSA